MLSEIILNIIDFFPYASIHALQDIYCISKSLALQIQIFAKKKKKNYYCMQKIENVKEGNKKFNQNLQMLILSC